jgi:hypothetical protein
VSDPELQKLQRFVHSWHPKIHPNNTSDENDDFSTSTWGPRQTEEHNHFEKIKNCLDQIASLAGENTALVEKIGDAQSALLGAVDARQEHQAEIQELKILEEQLHAELVVLTQERDQLALELHEAVSERQPALLCPISRDVLRDPVLLVASGHTYERSELARWLRSHDTDPLTNTPLATKHFVPNYLARAILTHRQLPPSSAPPESP